MLNVLFIVRAQGAYEASSRHIGVVRSVKAVPARGIFCEVTGDCRAPDIDEIESIMPNNWLSAFLRSRKWFAFRDDAKLHANGLVSPPHSQISSLNLYNTKKQFICRITIEAIVSDAASDAIRA